MKSLPFIVAALAPLALLAGCNDILALDNYDEPTSTLTGRVLFEGQPVGVRNGGVQLELWQPSYVLNQKIPVHINQDGTFTAVIFDGSYKLNLLAGNGPWVDNKDTTRIELQGEAAVDVPVTPYYTIRSPVITRGAPTTADPGGTITVTFKVGQINTTRLLEYVGVYVGTTMFVDRVNSLQLAATVRERLRAVILTQLNANSDITITVTLPPNIYEASSPVRRDEVFVRIGVKTVGVAEMLFTPVQKITI